MRQIKGEWDTIDTDVAIRSRIMSSRWGFESKRARLEGKVDGGYGYGAVDGIEECRSVRLC